MILNFVDIDYTTLHSHECGAVFAADENALKILMSHIGTATKQLQKPNPAPLNRNLLLIFNILMNISTSTAAGDIIAKAAPTSGKDIFSLLFSILFNYLTTLSKQPSASNELYKNCIDILRNFFSRNSEIRKRFTQNPKWLEGLSRIAKAERERAKVTTGTGGGAGAGGKGKKGTGNEEGRLRVEKIEELLVLLR